MWVLAVVAAPLVLAGIAAAVGIKLLGPSAESVREHGVALWLLIVLIALVPAAWLVIRAAGDEPAGSGTCPAINDGLPAVILVSMYFGAAIVGGVAVAATYVADRDALKAGGFALAAVVVPYVVGGVYLLNGFCWY